MQESQYEFSYARLEGVEFEYNKRPLEIVDEGVIFCDVIENEDGSFTDAEGSERGLLVDDEFGHTTREGVFSSGDVVHGPRTVVEAVAHSKIVAEAMHKYMQSIKD